MDIERSTLETLIKQIILEKLGKANNISNGMDYVREVTKSGVIAVKVPTVKVDESNRLDTGKSTDQVYTKDVFTLQESPRLGCGVMEMKSTTFDWHLNYDEIDYVIEGSLSIIINGEVATAHAGELVLIPKGSSIKFSVPNYARFIYITYPADWANQP
ncbi:ethanolamine utilization protein EutQ [Sporanaerobium hydrogeniformans]|uniref:Ethanolamine utilization protein EutQ n=1 Tax=Sporanaerobium hydrogeniformans TaxID=3072179 RepID=A0AC61DCK1_9FIRM|nr:cupin domain-containing protein [Sporanaerobium hydrogeniformans]PHV70297.1 ethanolamine utilization protein EutQ [Sporanaerobium hydrogeniformans]